MLKAGVNESDLVAIKKMAAEGISAGKIAKQLMVMPEVIDKFMPPKPKAKPVAKKTAAKK